MPSCASTAGASTVLELAARSIGGLCARALRFGAGVSLEELIIAHALGMGLDGLTREAQASGVMMLPIRAAGRARPGVRAWTTPAPSRASPAWRSASPPDVPWSPCPRATATSGSSSPGPSRPERSRTPFVRPSRGIEVHLR